MGKRNTAHFIFSLFFTIFFYGCGGGGTGSKSTLGPCGVIGPGDIGVPRLQWSSPTTNADGSTLDDLAGFKLRYGSEPGNYIQVVDLGNQSTCALSELAPGTWYFVVTAYDIWKNESDFSNEISYLILE